MRKRTYVIRTATAVQYSSGALKHGTCMLCQKYGVVKLVSGQYFEMFVRLDFMNVGTFI